MGKARSCPQIPIRLWGRGGIQPDDGTHGWLYHDDTGRPSVDMGLAGTEHHREPESIVKSLSPAHGLNSH